MIVALIPDEWIYIKDLGRRRQLIQEANKVRNNRVANLSDMDLHIVGVAGEYAFRKQFACLAGWQPVLDRGDGGSVDIFINGHSISVKTRYGDRGGFIVPPTQDFTANIGVVAYVREFSGSVEFAGWMRHEDYLRERSWADWLPEAAWLVEAPRLRPMNTLDRYLRTGSVASRYRIIPCPLCGNKAFSLPEADVRRCDGPYGCRNEWTVIGGGLQK